MPRTFCSLLTHVTLVTTLIIAPHHGAMVLIAAEPPAVASVGFSNPISLEPVSSAQLEPITAEQIREKLASTLVRVEFTETSIQDALTFISDQIAVEFIGFGPLKQAFAEEGIADVPINLVIKQRPITAKMALDLIIEETSRYFPTGMYYTIQEGMIQLKVGKGDFQTKIINCRSWLSRVEPEKDADNAVTSTPGQTLVDILRNTVAPNSWQDSGGGQGAIREFGGLLIVRQTAAVHEQVDQLIAEIAQEIEK